MVKTLYGAHHTAMSRYRCGCSKNTSAKHNGGQKNSWHACGARLRVQPGNQLRLMGKKWIRADVKLLWCAAGMRAEKKPQKRLWLQHMQEKNCWQKTTVPSVNINLSPTFIPPFPMTFTPSKQGGSRKARLLLDLICL